MRSLYEQTNSDVSEMDPAIKNHMEFSRTCCSDALEAVERDL
jgi:hypothetical protein